MRTGRSIVDNESELHAAAAADTADAASDDYSADYTDDDDKETRDYGDYSDKQKRNGGEDDDDDEDGHNGDIYFIIKKSSSSQNAKVHNKDHSFRKGGLRPKEPKIFLSRFSQSNNFLCYLCGLAAFWVLMDIILHL